MKGFLKKLGWAIGKFLKPISSFSTFPLATYKESFGRKGKRSLIQGMLDAFHGKSAKEISKAEEMELHEEEESAKIRIRKKLEEEKNSEMKKEEKIEIEKLKKDVEELKKYSRKQKLLMQKPPIQVK